MPISIPRVNALIGTTGFNFTPENLARWIDFIAPQLEGISGSGGGLSNDITGYGRYAGSDYFSTDATRPRVPVTPALVIELPNATFNVQENQIVLDDPIGVTTIDVPANMMAPGKYGYLSTYEIEDSGGERGLEITSAHWFDELQPSLSAAGYACIGRVISDADTVISIAPTYEDVIVPLPVLLAQLKTLSGGGGGGETGGVPLSVFNATVTRLQGEIDALGERYGLASGGSLYEPNKYEIREKRAPNR